MVELAQSCSAESADDSISKIYSRGCSKSCDAPQLVKDDVDAEANSSMPLNLQVDIVTDVMVVSEISLHVGQLGLIEVDLTVFSVPAHQIVKGVLHEEAVDHDVGSTHDEAVLVIAIIGGHIFGPPTRRAVVVVGMPDPRIVDDDVGAVKLHVHVGPSEGAGAVEAPAVGECPDSREDVGQHARVALPQQERLCCLVQRRRAGLEQQACDSNGICGHEHCRIAVMGH